ncbi:hypothetical protein AVEN_92710-1 [Araneus ventricosus]|uniref:Uncharacterized protein n=1 Tax=Araneus ventricosus TaxID=182803 RepID=A0A4Y2LY84_ARAVE|nr:hypothetical protein AVEN_233648-1 [Araneus ventricosus]GBN19785.1 hypothetical protein AVEN_247538-1 [Araneus ventricosus]GBN20365.1 hypothetical protein AVEN_92710-1 [Araneus ventricosus]
MVIPRFSLNFFREKFVSVFVRDLAANFSKTNGESPTSDKSGAEKFVSEFKGHVAAEGFILQQQRNWPLLEENVKEDVHYTGGKCTAWT